jgi:hypothetical protein
MNYEYKWKGTKKSFHQTLCGFSDENGFFGKTKLHKIQNKLSLNKRYTSLQSLQVDIKS